MRPAPSPGDRGNRSSDLVVMNTISVDELDTIIIG